MIDTLIEKLIGLFAERFLPDRCELREERAREELVFLLEALRECHNSYIAYEKDANEHTYRIWRTAVADLVRTLDSLRLTLSTL